MISCTWQNLGAGQYHALLNVSFLYAFIFMGRAFQQNAISNLPSLETWKLDLKESWERPVTFLKLRQSHPYDKALTLTDPQSPAPGSWATLLNILLVQAEIQKCLQSEKSVVGNGFKGTHTSKFKYVLTSRSPTRSGEMCRGFATVSQPARAGLDSKVILMDWAWLY